MSTLRSFLPSFRRPPSSGWRLVEHFVFTLSVSALAVFGMALGVYAR